MKKILLYPFLKFCKLLLLFCAGLCFTIHSMAQNKTHRFFAGFSPGVNIPVGQFANKAHTDEFYQEAQNGMAKTGISGALFVGYNVIKNINLLLTFTATRNHQDNKSLEQYWTVPTNVATGAHVKTGNWNIFSILGGAEYSIPVTSKKRLITLIKISGGACKTTAPGYTGNPYLPDGTEISGFFVVDEPLKWTFCYQAGAGVRYQLNKQFLLSGNVAYFDAAPDKEITFYPNGPILPGPSKTIHRKYRLGSIQTGIGIGIQL